jgi:trans-aconitate methyltransferase
MTPEGGYRWDAADYAQHSHAQLAWGQELLLRLDLRGHETLLDLGCGDGKLTAGIADRLPVGRVVGVDRSAEMVRLAQAQHAAGRLNLGFAQMDAAWLAFRAAFDVVFSNAALHWVPDQAAVLRGVRRCLRAGGRLVAQMGGQGNIATMLPVVEAVMQRAAWRSHFAGFTFPFVFPSPADYARWVAAAGLRLQRVELIPKAMPHTGTRGLAAWLRTTWVPYVQRVPVDRREGFIAEVVTAYLAAHPLDADGVARVPVVRLEVEAVAA